MAASQQPTGSPNLLGLTSYNADGSLAQTSFPCDCCNNDLFCGQCELTPCNWLAPGYDPSGVLAHATLSAPGCQLDGTVVDLYGSTGCAPIPDPGSPYCSCGFGGYTHCDNNGFFLYGTKSVWVCSLVTQPSGRVDVEVVQYWFYLLFYCAPSDNRLHLNFGFGAPVMCSYVYSFPGPPVLYSGWNCTNATADVIAHGGCNAYAIPDCYHPGIGQFEPGRQTQGECQHLIGGGTCLYWTSQTFNLPVGTNAITPKSCYYLDSIGCSGVAANWIITP